MGAEPSFPVPSDEAARLVALGRYDVLAGPPLPDLESVVGLAADLCGIGNAVKFRRPDRRFRHRAGCANWSRPEIVTAPC